ncbi:hypothetical protein L21_1332 [Methanoculleus chikugoensis]|uniref:Uncharacterized protein n=1 Tax=Methanoculleus chikugoensis TaxID=118126 RepID=A0A1M4MKL4_9EURY|nr:hypothetical protein L21_1332 [Methanoculleus chikugoensis]
MGAKGWYGSYISKVAPHSLRPMVIEFMSITYAHPRLSTGYRRDCPRRKGEEAGGRAGWGHMLP